MNLSAFLGNDEIRKQEALDAALAAWNAACAKAGEACAQETHFGEELRWEQIAESYQTPDLFAPRKSIVIRNWDKANASQQKNLEQVFRAGNPAVAVFLTAEKWDARSTFRKAAEKSGTVEEFKVPYPEKIPQWIAQRAQGKYGRRIGAQEARLLQEVVGGNLHEIDHELEKLDTFLPKAAPIGAADIQDIVSPLKVFGIFEFLRTLGLRRKAELAPSLRNLLDNDFPAFLVAQRAFAHFLVLLRFRTLLDEGMDEGAIAAELKLNQFLHIQKERYPEQARSRSQQTWKRLLTHLAKLEIDLKQGKYPNRFEVEMAFAYMV